MSLAQIPPEHPSSSDHSGEASGRPWTSTVTAGHTSQTSPPTPLPQTPGRRPGRRPGSTAHSWGQAPPGQYLQGRLSPQPAQGAPGARASLEFQWARRHQQDLSPLEIPGRGKKAVYFKGSPTAWVRLPEAPPHHTMHPLTPQGPSEHRLSGLELEAVSEPLP